MAAISVNSELLGYHIQQSTPKVFLFSSCEILIAFIYVEVDDSADLCRAACDAVAGCGCWLIDKYAFRLTYVSACVPSFFVWLPAARVGRVGPWTRSAPLRSTRKQNDAKWLGRFFVNPRLLSCPGLQYFKYLNKNRAAKDLHDNREWVENLKP